MASVLRTTSSWDGRDSYINLRVKLSHKYKEITRIPWMELMPTAFKQSLKTWLVKSFQKLSLILKTQIKRDIYISSYQNVYKSIVDSKNILNIFLGQILRKLQTIKETAGFDFFSHTLWLTLPTPNTPKLICMSFP